MRLKKLEPIEGGKPGSTKKAQKHNTKIVGKIKGGGGEGEKKNGKVGGDEGRRSPDGKGTNEKRTVKEGTEGFRRGGEGPEQLLLWGTKGTKQKRKVGNNPRQGNKKRNYHDGISKRQGEEKEG